LRTLLIAVLGMHRSGTSAAVGTMQQHGVELGPVSEENRSNPRGNRELRSLVRLHNRILERAGGSWWQPPAAVQLEPDDRLERDSALSSIPGDRIAVKDPRMLLLLELWRELEPAWVGVIRNPVAVRRSLERRAEKRHKPTLDPDGWEALWRHYNAILLQELERAPFPVIDFDRSDELDAQVRAALGFYGIETGAAEAFFDPRLVNEHLDANWREEVRSPDSLELWEQLAGRSVR
jgi:hypothetical protein